MARVGPQRHRKENKAVIKSDAKSVLHIALTVWDPVVCSCTTRFDIQKVYFHFIDCIMCFICISEQTATFAVYNINVLVFIPEAVIVYCAVRTEFLYIIQFKSTLQRDAECCKAIHLVYSQTSVHERLGS